MNELTEEQKQRNTLSKQFEEKFSFEKWFEEGSKTYGESFYLYREEYEGGWYALKDKIVTAIIAGEVKLS